MRNPCIQLTGVLLAMLFGATALGQTSVDLEVLRARAEQGDAKAQLQLGDMHAKGTDVDRSATMAEGWYLKAAEQGFARAQARLGALYEGMTFAGDADPVQSGALAQKAADWYLKAAEQNDMFAQHSLGNMYLRGSGVALSSEEAVKWFLKSAEQGHTLAQIDLAYAYKAGKGVTMDLAQACYWMSRAFPLAKVRNESRDELCGTLDAESLRDIQLRLDQAKP